MMSSISFKEKIGGSRGSGEMSMHIDPVHIAMGFFDDANG